MQRDKGSKLKEDLSTTKYNSEQDLALAKLGAAVGRLLRMLQRREAAITRRRLKGLSSARERLANSKQQ